MARYTGEKVMICVTGSGAEDMMPYMARSLVNQTTWELTFTFGIAIGLYRPLVVISPVIAEIIAKSGWSKRDLQQRLFELARIPAREFEQFIMDWTNIVPGKRTLYDYVRMGKAPKILGESRDPNRLVPIVLEPEHIMIAVSGDPLRTNGIVFSHNGQLGFPTTKKVVLPKDWKKLMGRPG